MKKATKKNTVSPTAERILMVMEKLAGGSQRRFATMVGCSQAAVSKIANGVAPGRRLVQMVAELPSVNPRWLATGEGEPIFGASSSSTGKGVPIARGPAPGDFRLHGRFRSARQLSLFDGGSESVYAVPASSCMCNRALSRESIMPSDLLIIESDAGMWSNDVGSLEGKYVLVLKDPRSVVEVRRAVRVSSGEIQFCNLVTESPPAGNEVRFIDLPPDKEKPSEESPPPSPPKQQVAEVRLIDLPPDNEKSSEELPHPPPKQKVAKVRFIDLPPDKEKPSGDEQIVGVVVYLLREF
jgi:hypothetical protein